MSYRKQKSSWLKESEGRIQQLRAEPTENSGENPGNKETKEKMITKISESTLSKSFSQLLNLHRHNGDTPKNQAEKTAAAENI